ncbi:MAG: 16S rRNA (cytidine(1402)-2'-O)-methyltransferase [Methylococcales bacterium]
MTESINVESTTIESGLYLVSTPIGNLADITFRAVDILKSVDLIAAEDTRHSHRLFSHYAIDTACIAFHDHNEDAVTPRLLEDLQQGRSIAVISDAGTPLIRDPGYKLVREARRLNISVIPIPGCCAVIAALSASGLPTDRFVFFGYPPRTQSARQNFFQQLLSETGTVILYESSHRIRSCLNDLASVYPATRMVVVARELTKRHETIRGVTMSEIESLFEDTYAEKGEFVIVVQGEGAQPAEQLLDQQTQQTLKILMTECSLKTAVDLATQITGVRKKLLYQAALEYQDQL